MKVERIINIYKDNGTKIEIGDRVAVETSKDVYVGTVKSIKPNCMGVVLDVGRSVGITYKDIISII